MKMEFGVDVSWNATAALRSKRFWARNKTLLDLCIKCVLKNPDFFLGRTENPLNNLPNSIVQKFFLIMAQRFDEDLVEDFKPADLPLIFLLLNSRAEEFSLQNLLQSEHVYFAEAQPDNGILDHALKSCPNFRKIFISLDPFKGLLPEELATEISTNWQKLKHLTLQGKNILSDSAICLIAKHLPQLEFLAFIEKSYIEEESKILSQFTMASVDNLALMKKLQLVTFDLGYDVYFDDPIWAHVAGKVSALKKLSLQKCDLNIEIERNSLFIKNYEHLYPGKPLILDCIRIFSADFDVKWPQNVTFERLTIQGPDLPSLEVLSSIPKCTKMIRISHMLPQQVHVIVEIFGPSVIDLQIYELSNKKDDLININKLFLMCPQVESFDVEHPSGHYEINLPALPKKCFKHLKDFTVTDDEMNYLEEVFPVLKQVLLGSENFYWSPFLEVHATMSTILEVLRETKNCCKYYSNLNDFRLRSDQVPLQFQNDFLELAYRLMFTSLLLQHFLVEIVIPREADKVFCKNLIEKCKKLKTVSQTLDIYCKVELSFPHHRYKNVVI